MNTVQVPWAQPWVERLGWTLLHFLWQGALIALLLVAVRGLLGRRLSSNGRYLLACLALGAMLAAPFVTFSLVGSTEAQQPVAQFAAGVIPPDAPLVNAAPIAPWRSALALWRQALPWTVLAWLVGALLFSVRLAGGWICATRLRSAAIRPAPWEWQWALERLMARVGVSHGVRLLVSSLVDVPTVVGWLRPVVLVPVGALTGLPSDHVEALLAHELAHILRRDYLWNAMQGVAEALLFYHPAVWWVSNQIRMERELCCDDLAVAASGDVLTYARALAELESYRPARVRAALAANGGVLRHRIGRLLEHSQPVSNIKPGAGAVVAVGLALIAAAGAVVARGDQSAPSRSAAAVETPQDPAGVTVDVTGAGLIHRTPVAYPREAIAKGIEGTVAVQVLLDSQGNANDARVLSGPDALRKPVLQSVLQWHFRSGAEGDLRLVRIIFELPAADRRSEDQDLSAQIARELRRAAERHAGLAEQEPQEQLIKEYVERIREARRDQPALVLELLPESKAELDSAVSARIDEEMRRAAEQAQELARSHVRAERLNHLAEAKSALDADQQRLLEMQASLAQHLARQAADPKSVQDSREQIAARLQEFAAKVQATHTSAGRIVNGIEIRGLTDEAAADLLSRLPVHPGDTLSSDSIDAARRVVQEFDEHLRLVFVPHDDGVILRIGQPGTLHTLLNRPK